MSRPEDPVWSGPERRAPGPVHHARRPTVEIRRIDRSFNDEMLAILAESPIRSGGLSIVFDRRPDMFTQSDLKYDPAIYGGFFLDGRLRGFALLGIHQAFVNGIARPVMHFTDFYIRPDARGLGIPRKAMPFFFGEQSCHVAFGYAVIMHGNRPAQAQIDGRFADMPVVPGHRVVADLEVRSILLTTERKERTGIAVREARLSDVEEIVALLQAEHRDRLFGQVVDEPSFVQRLSRRPGLGIEDYRVTVEAGRVTGVAAAWDMTSFKQNRVIRYSPRMRLARGLHNLLAPVGGWGRLPPPGGVLRDACVTDMAVRDRNPRLLAALLERLYNEHRARGYNTLIVGSTADDPLLQATDRFSTVSVTSSIVLLARDPRSLEPGGTETRLPYIDVALL